MICVRFDCVVSFVCFGFKKIGAPIMFVFGYILCVCFKQHNDKQTHRRLGDIDMCSVVCVCVCVFRCVGVVSELESKLCASAPFDFNS